VSAGVEISVLSAPIADRALDQLASVLVDCVEGGASVSFMAPFSLDDGLAFFRKVAGSVAAGDTVLLVAKLDGKIVGTAQLEQILIRSDHNRLRRRSLDTLGC
jgi:hypothetical protein